MLHKVLLFSQTLLYSYSATYHQLLYYYTLDSNEMDLSKLKPTPLYNQAILEDHCLLLHHQITEKAILPFENIRHAIVLFKVQSMYSSSQRQ